MKRIKSDFFCLIREGEWPGVSRGRFQIEWSGLESP